MKKMKIFAWEGFFSKKILQRGKEYYLDGAVDELVYDEKKKSVSAAVVGTEEYNVEIGLTAREDDISYMSCDCPYAEDYNNCKHMAAVLYALEKDGVKVPKKPEKQLDLEECISKLSTEELRELVLYAAQKDSSVKSKILLKTNPETLNSQLKLWKKELSAITRSANGRNGFIEYRYAFSYTNELDDYMRERVPELISGGLLEGALKLVCAVYDEAFSVDMDDSDGGLTMLASECMRYWDEILENCPPELKRKVYPWFAKKGKDDLFAFDYKYTVFTEREFLEKQLIQVDELIERSSPNEFYYFESFIARRTELMQKLKYPEDEIKKYISKYRYLPEVRKKEIAKELNKKNYDRAISLLCESKEMDKAERPGLVSYYCRELIRIYDITGRKDEYRRELTDYVLGERQDDLIYVYLLKDITPQDDWAEMCERIIESGKIVYLKYDFYVKEKMYLRLFEELKSTESVYVFLQYEKVLKEHFPEKMRDSLLIKIDAEMKCADTRGKYYTVISYLKKVRKYPDGEIMAQELADKWKTVYPKRTAMLDELKKAKF